MADAESSRASCTTNHLFRGVEYIVTMSVDNKREVLSLEVEDRLTADQWTGQFDAKYIEELTRRTGNFKQFNVFVNMLELGCTKESGTLSLDLLTYGDLETLHSVHSSKAGRAAQYVPGTKATSHLHSKRYLIMTYTVEFDRIHYPLPLSYVGKPDPVQLQETIRKLTEENQDMKEHVFKKGSRNASQSRLQKEFDKLNEENEQLLLQFDTYKREMKHVGKANTAKEIRVLKKVVQNLESQLLKEKNKYQRILSKKKQDFKNLVAELEEVRANERNLRVRCRSLTNELAVLKRGSRSRATPSPRVLSERKGKENRRSLSQERRPAAKSAVGGRSRTPSPAGPRVPLFDPTAYVKERQRKQREASQARGRRRSSSGGSATRHRSRSLSSERPNTNIPFSGARLVRTSSTGSVRSQCSSQSSASGHSDGDGRPITRTHRQAHGRRKQISSKVCSSPEASDAGGRRKERRVHATTPYSSTPDQSPLLYGPSDKRKRHTAHRTEQTTTESLDRSADMMEIDARLDALQKFMKANLQ